MYFWLACSFPIENVIVCCPNEGLLLITTAIPEVRAIGSDEVSLADITPLPNRTLDNTEPLSYVFICWPPLTYIFRNLSKVVIAS